MSCIHVAILEDVQYRDPCTGLSSDRFRASGVHKSRISDMANLCYFGSYFETQGRITRLERKDIQCLLNRTLFLLVLSNVYAPSDWRCGCLEIKASFGNGKDGALYKISWPPIHYDRHSPQSPKAQNALPHRPHTGLPSPSPS